jgi:uncharacterized protein
MYRKRAAARARRLCRTLARDPSAPCRARTFRLHRRPALKLHAQVLAGANTITGYGEGFLEVNRQRHAGPLLVGTEGPVRAWQVGRWEDLDEGALAAVLELAPEVLLFGTGGCHRFAAPPLLAALARARVGFEVMDTFAACRTFNVLAAEGRRVVAALLSGGEAVCESAEKSAGESAR